MFAASAQIEHAIALSMWIVLLLAVAVSGAPWTNDTAVLYDECLVVPACRDVLFEGWTPSLDVFEAFSLRTGGDFLVQPAWWSGATLREQAVYTGLTVSQSRICSADRFPVLTAAGTFQCVCRAGLECAAPSSTHADAIIGALALLVVAAWYVLATK